MPLRLKLACLLVPIALLGWRAFATDQQNLPIRRGKAEDFWKFVTWVDGPSGSATLACPVLPIDGWCHFAWTGMHGSLLHRVPEQEVADYFPEILRRLDAAKDLRPWVVEGYTSWQRADPVRQNWQLLLKHLRTASNLASARSWTKNPEDKYDGQLWDSVAWGIAAQRMEQRPLLQFGEWLYLSGLVAFAAWPWLRSGGRWRWAAHVALLPWLLMLPYYLGYCSWTFTSAGPGGGAVYPMLLQLARDVPWYSADTFLVRQLPKPLGSLTGPLGSMMSLSGRSGCGPLAMGVIGLCLGAVAFAARTVIARGSSPTPAPRAPAR